MKNKIAMTLAISSLLFGFNAHSKPMESSATSSLLNPDGFTQKTLSPTTNTSTASPSPQVRDMVPGFTLERKGNDFSLKEICDHCYPKNIRGLKDNSKESAKRSQTEGAAIQYVIGSDAVTEAQIDTSALAHEVDDFVSVSAKYFKNKPEYQGSLMAIFAYFPNANNQPPQLEAPLNASAELQIRTQDLNQALKSNAKCNDKKACSVFALMSTHYQSEGAPLQALDKKEFSQFLQSNTQIKEHHVYHHNLDYKKPVFIVIYLGTNGYLVDKAFVEDDLKRLQDMVNFAKP